jgi:hypothetical protein
MQSLLKFISFFIIALINFNCSSSEAVVPPDVKTGKFSSYLKENFDDSIGSAPHLYFLIAPKDSRQNISLVLARLKDELKNITRQNYTMIISANVPVADSLIPKENSRTDWDNAIEELGFNFSGVAIVQTKNRCVTDILQLGKESTGMEKKFLDWK